MTSWSGFSRGAYQVRVLAGMIYEVGLIKNPTEKEIGTAYDHFESILSHQPNANDMAREFRRAFSWKDARVHFIGVWDTVSSVGIERGDLRLSASSAAAHACHIRHALALDECRVKFVPEYFLEMNSPDFHNAPEDSQLQSSDIEANNEKKFWAEATVHNPTSIPTSGESRSTSNNDIVVEDRNSTTVEKAQPAVVHTTSRTHPSTDECTDRKTTDIKEVWFAGKPF
ncbi:hypothetical protein J3R82DRAFT_11206 [Butyriboletus roseoflavus]|nr:hypothetical protein J3R82DRAFT_11206 [Butyriboletus roseoflavus]